MEPKTSEIWGTGLQSSIAPTHTVTKPLEDITDSVVVPSFTTVVGKIYAHRNVPASSLKLIRRNI